MRAILLTVIVVLFFTGRACADDEVKMDEATKKATAKALTWLAARQNPDGSWSDGRYPHNTAITSFALLAFLSQGHLPNQGQYGTEVGKGMRFLLASQREDDGYLVGARGGNMYCHGMATLALAELWGSTGDDAVKPVLKKAVELIVKSQNPEGGWRYEPRPSGADISVTIMQVMALRAAKNAGFNVPNESLKKAIKYVESCYNPNSGGFSYQAGGGAAGFARTAAGCCILFLAGDYNAKQLPKAIDYMKSHFETQQHFCYGHYYAAHAMHQVGGKEWADWYSRELKSFLPRQETDGSWAYMERSGPGPVYQTSIGVIILSVPTHYLSIFQR
jgi:Prenyltransferase and squalene oxidase repeat